jgi:hypothetical protein
MIKELPQKAVLLLTFIVNAILLTNYWPKQLKTAEIILIHKPGKDPTKVELYRPISLLPIIAKLLEKFLMHRLKNDPNTVELISHRQFGFREQHSTVQQTHRVVHTINQALDREEYCTFVFLDVKQAFDKVLHQRQGIQSKNQSRSIHQLCYQIRGAARQCTRTIIVPSLYGGPPD